MPFFRFSLKKNFLSNEIFPYINANKLKNNHTYFSKNTKLWKYLSKSEFKNYINFLNFEKRLKSNTIEGSVLFCLPPSLGLGDIIEYSLFFKGLEETKKFTNIGIAFTGRYAFFIKKYFKIKKVYDDVVSENDFNKYKNIFHITLEIKEFEKQKYIRSDIEKILNNYFDIKKSKKQIITTKSKIKKISIFPVSKSPIRSMSVEILKRLISSYNKKYQIEVILEDDSDISNYLELHLQSLDCTILKPSNLDDLCALIKRLEFGVFMDSGPLHLAKLFQKKGILIITSVSEKILLNNYNLILPVQNKFKSIFCSAPCGLTNIFNYNNTSGCFYSLKIKKKDFFKIGNLNSLQRGRNKDSYKNLMQEPVGCISNINFETIFKFMNNSLYK